MTKCKFCGKKFDDDKIVSVKLLNGEIVNSCESCKAKCFSQQADNNQNIPHIKYPFKIILRIILIYLAAGFIYGLIVNILKQFGILLGGIPTIIVVSVLFYFAHKLAAKLKEKFMRSNNNNLRNYKF